jgi:Flp pilus assembly CpaF family ATPase
MSEIVTIKGKPKFEAMPYRKLATSKVHRLMHALIGDWLILPGVSDIKCLPRGAVCSILVVKDGQRELVKEVDTDEVRRFLKMLATLCGKQFNRMKPNLDVSVPITGERISASMEPVTSGPQFAIRRPYDGVATLDLLLEWGGILPDQAAILRKIVAGSRDNLVISGEAGCGKTTLLRALLAEPAFMNGAPFIIQDPEEFTAPCPMADHFAADPFARPPITLSDLVAKALRNFPTHIVIGEVRRGEAYDFIMGLHTGHKGLCSLHAKSAWDALDRIAQMISLAKPVDGTMKKWIADSVNVVIHMTRDPGTDRRYVDEILRVDSCDVETGLFVMSPIFEP